MGLFSRKKSSENTSLLPPMFDKIHKRSDTSNSSSIESDFSVNHSESSQTSSETLGYFQHNKSPLKVKNVPMALRPKSAIVESVTPKSQAHVDSEMINDDTPKLENNNNELPILTTHEIEASPKPATSNSPAKLNSELQIRNDRRNEAKRTITPITNQQVMRSPQETPTKPISQNYNKAASRPISQNFEHPIRTPNHTPVINQPYQRSSSFNLNTPDRSIAQQHPYHRPIVDSTVSTNSSPNNHNVQSFSQNYQPINRQEQIVDLNGKEIIEKEDEEKEEEDEEDDDSDSDGESYGSEYTDSTVSNHKPTEHPYYEQWRKYYEALAVQYNRQSMYNPMMYYQMNPQMMQQMNPQLMQMQMMQMQMNPFLFNPYMMKQQQFPPQQSQSQVDLSSPPSSREAQTPSRKSSPKHEVSNDYLKAYKKSRNKEVETINEENQLVSNSRRSTIKSNRFPSAPQSQHKMFDSLTKSRTNSLDLNFKLGIYNNYDDEEEEDEEVDPDSTIQQMSNLKISDESRKSSRQISDYNAFLFDDDRSESEEENEADDTVIVEKPKEEVKADLSRKDTSSSDASGNSIQSNGSAKFSVAPIKSKPESPKAKQQKKKETKKLKKERPISMASSPFGFNNMSMDDIQPQHIQPPPFMIQPQQNFSPVSPYGMMDPMMMQYNPMFMQNTSYGGMNGSEPNLHNRRRQSITTTDAKRRSMMYETNQYNSRTSLNPNMKRNSMPVFPEKHQNNSPPPTGQPKINDSLINKKIEDFIRLRAVIASGNKSIEYRLHWVNMLITATNYKLYSYINIKGEFINSTQSAQVKSQFIKSAITHINKLIKEFESGKQERPGLISDTYYTWALLLKQDYKKHYGQDFSIRKDLDLCIEYMERVLSIEPKNYKALFKLGEIYESEFNDLDKAMDNYITSAKYGYNKAIFKISMVYLNNPNFRSIKYLKYLKNLSSIELSSVRLDDEDYQEMKEVVAEACYEIGKVYEGIYPGDLQAEDEFIIQSLEEAPVNYAKSLTYYNKAAKLNNLNAQVRLGLVYEHGELNRKQNANKSIQWFIKASSSPLIFNRHPDAMLGLSRWCLKGSNDENKHIPSPMPDKAIMWCERAIKEYNSKDAMVMMGELIEMGYGQGNSTVWYREAYELGSETAAQKLGY
ncbi:unnamed protein product [Candida verbasci]|uniref:HCP-like protein n=1 Tax=Candida verbasci TaxID=1227364 RepID=A0A9W4TT01_9ASCO|nr:unnamed protein product [Candida verbasci]